MPSLMDSIASDARALLGRSADGGVAATITPTGGTAGEVRGSFRDASESLDPSGVGLIDSGPVLSCAAADVATVKSGDPCVISGVTYYVLRLENSGFGLATLHLSQDEP